MESITWDMFVDETKERIDVLQECLSEDYRGIVIWFHADWCGPCERLKPSVKELMDSEEGTCWKWVDIMVPHDPFEKEELKSLWGFKTIPFFVVWDRNENRGMKWESFKQYLITQN